MYPVRTAQFASGWMTIVVSSFSQDTTFGTWGDTIKALAVAFSSIGIEKLIVASGPIQVPAVLAGRLADRTVGGAEEMAGGAEEMAGGAEEVLD
jgi:hypothetical protein